MAARPTTVQETALVSAMANTSRIGDATIYADRTLNTMQRNGWITRPNSYTYRVTPESALALGRFTLADQYRTQDLLDTDPKAQRQAAVVEQARAVGIDAFAPAGVTETVTISVEDLARLLTTANLPAQEFRSM